MLETSTFAVCGVVLIFFGSAIRRRGVNDVYGGERSAPMWALIALVGGGLFLVRAVVSAL